MNKIWGCFLLMCMFCSCMHVRPIDGKVITVTIEPLRYFTESIAGEQYQVISMVPSGNNPETYDPNPQQFINLRHSEAYFRIGYIGFEQAWMRRLCENNPNLKVIDTSNNVSLIYYNEHARGTNNVEPHIWNSTTNAKLIAENICTALCELDSLHTSYYRHRLDSLVEIIDKTDQRIRQILPKEGSTFLIYHPALSYFARDYGLKQISIEEGGKEPTPTQLKTLISTCKNEQVKVIFVQQEFDTRNTQLIADELHIPIVPINPLSYHWQEEMIKIAQALSE